MIFCRVAAVSATLSHNSIRWTQSAADAGQRRLWPFFSVSYRESCGVTVIDISILVAKGLERWPTCQDWLVAMATQMLSMVLEAIDWPESGQIFYFVDDVK